MELFSNLLFTFFMLIVIQLLLWQSAKLQQSQKSRASSEYKRMSELQSYMKSASSMPSSSDHMTDNTGRGSFVNNYNTMNGTNLTF